MTTAPAPHPSPEQLRAFRRGDLGADESTFIEEHLAGCNSCCRWLESLTEDALAYLVRQAAGSAPAKPGPRFLPGYEILREIGAGGMGVVYLARQAALGRVVALKQIRAGARADPETLARFRREAEAVARLDHPNIVRVYEAGEQDGQPYLAMEYVDGGTLAQVLAGTPLAPPVAAELLETLARAVEHSHQRGIVHRDLKPGNILLQMTKDQCPMTKEEMPSSPLVIGHWSLVIPKITDFGLARCLGGAGHQTQTGVLLGTPAYMAPEQAGGKIREVGPAADVYALGAILYETLTGRPPFQGATPLETMEQVVTQDPVPPSRLQPRIPRDLETICLKCLEKHPSQRYASAAALAEDLGRFRVGEPIRARPASWHERAWKWARRRPTAAALLAVSALALLAGVGGLWLHTVRLDAAFQEVAASEARAVEQRRRAEENYQQARQAIRRLLDHLNAFHLPDVPRVAQFRRQLQGDVLGYYGAIARLEEDPDPAVRFDVAQAYLEMMKVQTGQGQLEEAWASGERARHLLEDLTAHDPGRGEYRRILAECCQGLSLVHGGLGRAQTGAELLQQAFRLRQTLAAERPDDLDVQLDLARSYLNLGVGQYEEKQWEEAEKCWRQALALRQRAARERPDNPLYQREVAVCFLNLGLVCAETNRRQEEGECYRQADTLLTAALAREPGNGDFRYAQGALLRVWGAYLITTNRPAESLDLYARALPPLEGLLREDPFWIAVRSVLHGCRFGRAHACILLGQPAEAEREWRLILETANDPATIQQVCEHCEWWARRIAYAPPMVAAATLEARPDLTPENRYHLAVAYALSVGAVQRDSGLDPAERKRRADRYAGRALELLRRLQGAGYFKDAGKIRELERDGDLVPFRQRPEVRPWLADRSGGGT